MLEIGAARVPSIGLGTWRVTGDACERMTEQAVEVGYRYFDTTPDSENLEEIGRALDRSGVDRAELFVASRLPQRRLAADEVPLALDEILTALRLDRLDLLSLQWPSPNVPLEETLDAMLELKRGGLVHHLGVANLSADQMEQAWRRTIVLSNQVELHPFLAQRDVVEKARARNMVVVACGPLARGAVRDDPALVELGRAHGKSPSQIALRWLVQQDVAAIPRASSSEHLAENLDVFDFELSEEEMRRVHALDRGRRTDTASTSPEARSQRVRGT